MKFILPSVLFILLPTKAVAGLRKDVDDGPVTHVSLAKKKHGKQHKEDRSGEPRVESFGIAGLGIQGSKVKKQIADSHLSNLLNSDFDSRIVGGSQSSPAEFPYFGEHL